MLGYQAISQRALSEVGSLAALVASLPTYEVAVEFVTGSYTNIIGNVQRFNVNRPLSTMFSGLLEGRMVADVENSDGSFSPGNMSSPYAPNLVPGKRIRARAHWQGTTYNLFYGRITDFNFDPEHGSQRLVLEAVDGVRRMRNQSVTTSLFTNTNPASLFSAVTTQCLVNSFTSDALSDTIPFAWYRDVQADTAVSRILEFGRYTMYQDAAGTLKLNNRQWGQTLTAVNTFTSVGSDGFFGFKYNLNENTIINRIKIEAQPRQASTSQNTVAFLVEKPTIAASGSIGFWLSYVDPVEPTVLTPATSLQTPVNSTDYTTNTASDGLGTDRTATCSLSIQMFGAAAVCSLFNGSGDTVYLTKFQIRGFSVRQQPPLSKDTDVASSQDLYGIRAFALQNDFMGTTQYVTDYVTSLALDKNRAQARLMFGRKNDYPNILTLELGNIVALINSLSGVNSQWLVIGIEHDVSLASGVEHTMLVSAEDFGDKSVLVLDHAVFGVLDGTRKLAF